MHPSEFTVILLVLVLFLVALHLLHHAQVALHIEHETTK
jgi:hypothetical protein